MTDRELMQMALDALMTCQEDWIFDGEDERPVDTYDEKMVSAAFKALRDRLAEHEPDDGYCQACEGNYCTAKNGCVALDNPKAQPEPEPVAWLYKKKDGMQVITDDPDYADGTWTPLYTAPPQREWQGLTDEEGDAILDTLPFGYSPAQFYLAIEAKLKEKNGF